MDDRQQAIRDVYIAGPLFSPAERAYLDHIDELCRNVGLSTYLPHRDVGFGPARDEQAQHYFQHDLWMLRNSRCVIAVLNGADVDSGTAWEVGFAYSSGKCIIGIREDCRDGEVNPMLACTLRLTRSFTELRDVLTGWRAARSSDHE